MITTCPDPHCMGKMVFLQHIEDYDFDWEGEPERDDDGYPIFVEYAVYQCEDCQTCEREFVRYLYEPPYDDD